MGLTSCPDCGGNVSDSARACPHCGRPTTTVLSTDTQHKPVTPKTRAGCGMIAGVIALCLIGLFVALAFIGSIKDGGNGKTMDVAVSVNRFMVTVTNKGTTDMVGQDMDVFINGSPPSGYEATVKVPPVGESRSILLDQFVDGDTRFDSASHIVTKVSVGAGKYQFAEFDIRR
jgi:hypothetical protein